MLHNIYRKDGLMKKDIMYILTGGGGSPEQSQEEICGYEIDGNHEQSSARRGRPRSFAQARALAFSAKGGEPSRAAFTMAEILLSLTIIGVVAAITLPSLTGNINERTWNTQRKALFARFSQAIPLMGAVNGYSDSETFIAAGLSKVLKINNICDDTHIADCGIPAKFVTLAGSNYSYSLPFKISDYQPKMTNVSYSTTISVSYAGEDTHAAAFETANGESILLFYFPKCQPDMNEATTYLVQPKICVNMIYDLNGSKGPNTVGKDVGVMTVLYSTDSVVVAPQVWYRNSASVEGDYRAAQEYCKGLDSDLRMPNLDELASIFVNNSLLDVGDTWAFWSSKVYSTTSAWDQSFVTGNRRITPKTDTAVRGRCVYR